MPMIREAIITTVSLAGKVHVAPFGLIAEGNRWVIAPFRPSTTLDNLIAVPYAVANFTDDVRLFAGCLTGRRDWPLVPASRIAVSRIADALAHAELAVEKVAEDAARPRFVCGIVHEETHAPFGGFNRAKAAVIEACILLSRLHMLPRQKVEQELAYLTVAVEKTAGPEEAQAWSWLMDEVKARYATAGS
ncbi:MAG: DUF447 family protein [Hyphomicrobiales bacterium]|nr:DUF447 family protein [Hyphomicrobiales bacterium]